MQNKSVKDILNGLMPRRMAILFLGILKLAPQKKVNQLKYKERKNIVSLIKGFRMDIAGACSFDEAMITCGGISLKDINPRTMESRLIRGLYFAGEIIDVDADTGGFNLQAAFSTGYLAGESAAH
jgi:predicted Rossmann fold flavoprotein